MELRIDRGGKGPVGCRSNGLWTFDHDGSAAVTAKNNVGVEWDGAQERDAEVGAHVFASALTEHVGIGVAVRAGEGAHVLDDADDGHVDGFEHSQATSSDLQTDILRRGDNDHAREAQALGKRQLGVTGPWGQVEDQIIELSPANLSHHHLEILGDHRAAHDGRVVVVPQQAHRGCLDAITLGGNHAAIGCGRGRLINGQAEHARDARAEDVRVDQTNPAATLRERYRKVHGDG